MKSNVVGLKELTERRVPETQGQGCSSRWAKTRRGSRSSPTWHACPIRSLPAPPVGQVGLHQRAIITGLLLTHTPDTLRLLMVDPKMVELSVYNGVPHLLSPVVTEVDKAAAVLYHRQGDGAPLQLAGKVNARPGALQRVLAQTGREAAALHRRGGGRDGGPDDGRFRRSGEDDRRPRR
ncbi:MAG: FtsK/SpoIIIE domain-containing protein [Caldilineaceae bacterium]